MSQVAQATISPATQVRSPHESWAAAVLAFMAIAAVVLILALQDESPRRTSPERRTSARSPVRGPTAGPRSHVAASVGSRPAAGPDEARIAGSIGTATPEVSGGPDEMIAVTVGGSSSASASGPDESRIAVTVGGSSSATASGPDESQTAAAISGRQSDPARANRLRGSAPLTIRGGRPPRARCWSVSERLSKRRLPLGCRLRSRVSLAPIEHRPERINGSGIVLGREAERCSFAYVAVVVVRERYQPIDDAGISGRAEFGSNRVPRHRI